MLETARAPGRIVTLPNRWAADEAWTRAADRTQGADTRQARAETPQFQFAADRAAAIGSGAMRAAQE